MCKKARRQACRAFLCASDAKAASQNRWLFAAVSLKGASASKRPCPSLGKDGAVRGYAHFALRARARSQAPRLRRGLRKPWKGILPASLSKGTECSAFCIICPVSRKQGSSRCVLQLFDIEYRPASLGTDSESPFTLPGTAGGVSLKPKNRTGACRAPILHVGNQLPGSGERLVPKPESPEKARRRNKGTAGKAQGPFRHMA